MAYGLSLVAGVLTILSPCILPTIPILVGSAFQKNRLGPVAIVLGMMTSFTIVGVTLSSLNQLLGLQNAHLRLGAAVLLVGFGISLLSSRWQGTISLTISPWFSRLQNSLSEMGSRWGFWGFFVVGSLLGIVWTPCAGPTLGAALTLAAQQGNRLVGISMMLVFAIGVSIPLMILAYGCRSLFFRYATPIRNISKYGNVVFGILVLGLGIGVLTGLDRMIQTELGHTIPPWLLDISTQY